MASKLKFLQQRYAESSFDRTWQGRIFVLTLHVIGFYCIFRALIVRSCILHPTSSDITKPTPSVPFNHLPSSHPPFHADRPSPIPKSPRLHPRTTHTTPITCNRGEHHLFDSSGEPCPCWCRHRWLHLACPTVPSVGASCHAQITKSRRFAPFLAFA
jgi:hypothetical protein